LKTASKFATRHKHQSGFTLVELLMATVIVLFGLVAVAQLVPVSVLMNSNNRNDGTALVFAQRELEAMRGQPLTATTFADPMGTDPTKVTCPPGYTCRLGDAAQPNIVLGGPVLPGSSGDPIIDFSATAVNDYSFTYLDPNDPFSAQYDVRWAVVTTVNAQQVVTGKRIIVGVFRRGMKTVSLPITLDTMVEK
jgi:prepilin-type N-terminal cleavage/methylation domain-containing protein